MEQTLTHWKKLTNPNYLGAYSLLPNEERAVEIIKVVREQVIGSDGKKEECTVAHLKNEKPFILNTTNCKTLSKVFGTPFIEQWAGKRCIVYSAKIRAFGEDMEALRVKQAKAPLPELTPLHEKWNGAVKSFSEGKVTIAWIRERYILSKENEEKLIKESES